MKHSATAMQVLITESRMKVIMKFCKTPHRLIRSLPSGREFGPGTVLDIN
jgi:hypothetical protein